MATRQTGYHHGDLRSALLDACLALIEDEGIGAVSLRKVARAAGVSSGAPYHHFTDRSELLAALATRGFELLGDELVAIRDGAADPTAALRAMLTAYLSFARRHPDYFRLMFRPELSRPEKHPDTVAASQVALNVVADVVAGHPLAGRNNDDCAPALTMLCWSVGHGLASLEVDGKLGDGVPGAVPISDEVIALFTTLLAGD